MASADAAVNAERATLGKPVTSAVGLIQQRAVSGEPNRAKIPANRRPADAQQARKVGLQAPSVARQLHRSQDHFRPPQVAKVLALGVVAAPARGAAANILPVCRGPPGHRPLRTFRLHAASPYSVYRV